MLRTHFTLMKNSPIKAYGNCYFIRENNPKIKAKPFKNEDSERTLDKEAQNLGITLQKFQTPPSIRPFVLPNILDLTLFDKSLNPLYLLPPI